MRQLLVIGLAMGLVLAAGTFVVVHDVPESVEATHGNFNVHAHDDYFHPTGSFVPGPAHANAIALCQQSNPDPSCTSVIHVGDSITWVAPAPLAANPHTITECTDGSFTNCGAAVDPNNPIGDSGIISPPNPGPSGYPYGPIAFTVPGSYFYRCDIHPTVMRGRVLVTEVGTPPAGPPAVGGIAGLSQNGVAPASPGMDGRSSGGLWLVGSAAVAALVVAAGGASLWRRAARRPVMRDDRADEQS